MKNTYIYRSILSIFSLIIIVGTFTSCVAEKVDTEGKLKIGVIQLMDHSSLSEIYNSFEAELKELTKDTEIEYVIDYKNAQNDSTLLTAIARQFVNDKVDVIVAITTPSAQAAVSATSDIPIIFSAVSDPLAVNLLSNVSVPEGNVTGVSDAIDPLLIFDLAKELTPNVKSFGFLYNMGEVNSVSVIENAKKVLDGHGITYGEKIVTQGADAQSAVRTLLETYDAIFVPIDNTVASVMAMVSAEAINSKKPLYVAADSMVKDGALATVGINYTTLGKETALMVKKVLSGTKISEIPVLVMDTFSALINRETATALSIDLSKFKAEEIIN